MTIDEFLTARIAEDEDPEIAAERFGVDRIADMSRVLAECEAKRRIVDLHAPTISGFHQTPVCETCLTERVGYSDDWGPDAWPCDTIRALVTIYADHPDFDRSWLT